MSKYTLYFTQTASATVDVEADDLESAAEKAYAGLPVGVCAHCSGWGQKWSFDLGGVWELDEEAARADYPDGTAP